MTLTKTDLTAINQLMRKSLKENNAQISEAIDNLAEHVDERFDKFDERFDDMERRFNNLTFTPPDIII